MAGKLEDHWIRPLLCFIETDVMMMLVRMVMICVRNDDPDVADCPAVFFRFVYLHVKIKYLNGKQLGYAIN